MRSIRIPKPRLENSCFALIAAPSSTGCGTGTLVNVKALTIGTTAHITVRIRQLSMPHTVKNSVLSRTTAACPQQ
ncbi:unknown [Candidatus Colimorpha enterica]|uniref:Uncharacterized protein n=1 Tax=Candidatus Colimorpha enterica TaxID=3083063 RepID=R6TVD1_9BACT|nr:unknown [Candidatus Colimorpha enterica]